MSVLGTALVKEYIEIVTVSYKCPTTGNVRTAEFGEISTHRNASCCSGCSTHGSVELEVRCTCGKTHWMTLFYW